MKGATNLKAEVLTVTPQVARDWLAERTANRRVSEKRVQHYAKRMAMGEWKIAQPILIDESGFVFDGQHRLKSVIQNGKPIEFLVIKGYPSEETFGVVDDTRPRNLRDWLHLLHEENADELAPLLRLVFLYERGVSPTGSTPLGFTPQVGVDLLEKYPELRDCVKAPGVTSNGLIPRSLSAFLFWRFWRIDKALAKSFFVDLIMAEQEQSEGDPIVQLHAILRRNRESKGHGLKMKYIAAITVKSWNAVRTGRTNVKIKMQDGELFPEAV